MSAYTDELTTLGFTGSWLLEETTGTTATDDIGSDDGTYGAGVTLNQAALGNDGASIEFDGTSAGNYVEDTAPTTGTFTDAGTGDDRVVFITFNLDTVTKDQMLFQQGGKSEGYAIYVFGSDSKLYVNMNEGGGDNYSGSTAALSANTSYSFCMVQDGDTIYGYLDGTESFTIDITAASGSTINPQGIIVGDAQGSSTSVANLRPRLHNNDATPVAGDMEVDGNIGEVAYKSNGTITAAQASTLHDRWKNGAAAGDDHTLTPNDCSVSSALDSTTITQNHVLSPSDLSVSGTLDTTTITQNHVLAPVDGSVSSSLDQTSVTEDGDAHTLSPDDASVSSTLDQASITQVHVLSPVEGSVSSSLDSTTITQVHILNVNDGSVSSALDQTTVDLSTILTASDLSVAATLDATSISQVHILSPDDGSVSSVVDTSSLTGLVYVLAPDDLSVTVALDETAVSVPSGVVSATVSLGANYSGSVSLDCNYSGTVSLGEF